MRRSGSWLVLTGLLAACSGKGTRETQADAAPPAVVAPLLVAPPAVPPPENAAAPVRLTDPSGTVTVAFSLNGASPVPGVGGATEGATFFPSAFHGADVRHVARAGGVEDLVYFQTKPGREELTYSVDVSRVAGLRLVGSVLELLDRGGAPRLRVQHPWVRGADGVQRSATLSLAGCDADTSSAPPWRRPVVAPGADVCELTVAWSGAPYPVVVDPLWTPTMSLMNPRDSHAMVTLATGDLLVVDGYNHASGGAGVAGTTATGESYNVATGTWAMAGDIPWESMGGGRYNLAATLLPNGKVLTVGGGVQPQPDLYTPGPPATAFMRSNASFTTASFLTATMLGNGLVLVAGGFEGPPQAAAMLYDPTADTFNAAGSLVVARGEHTATMLASGKVLFVGGATQGDGGNVPLASAEIYDPVANTFSLTGSMKHPRAGHVAALLQDGRVVVTGGGDASAEIYDPSTGAFSVAGAMSSDRVFAQAVVLPTGHVMVAGGELAGQALASVDIFDPPLGTFATATPLNSARESFTAAVLPSGEVLVVGGLVPGLAGGSGTSTGSVETWTATAGGTLCQKMDDCSSAVCRGGFCCSSQSCDQPCRTCTADAGACAPILSMDDPDSCTGRETCDPSGACRLKNGQSCSATTDCASGFCVDGFCCDSACGGECQACDLPAAPGVCSAVVGDSHGARARCGEFGTTCGGACDGIDTAECVFPSAVTACGSTCEAGTATVSACDGTGSCVTGPREACSGNFACASSIACRTSCAADAECAEGFHCSGDKCLPSAFCEGSVLHVFGHTTDCTPYNCEQSGSCLTRCAVVSDCAAPNVCTPGGECISPSLLAPGSGCTTSGGGAGGAWAAAGLCLVTALRRRRRSR